MGTCISTGQGSFFTRSNICLYLSCLLLLVSIIVNPCLVRADSNGVGRIQGVITNQAGQPLSGIRVCVTEHSANLSYTPFFPYVYPPWMDEEIGQDMYEGYIPYWNYYPSSPPMYGTTSQQDGGFLIDNLQEGRYILWAYDSEDTGLKPSIYGYQEDLTDDQTSSEGYYGYVPRPNYIPVRVSAGETAGPFTLVMEPGGILSGRITDEEDESAIVNATIMAVPFDQKSYMMYECSFYAASDENGDFVFAGLAEGRYQLSVTEADDYVITPIFVEDSAGTQEHVYEVLAGQVTSGCIIAVQRGGVIQGRVLHHETGNPVAGVYVSAYETESGGYGYSSYPIKTGADGTYRFSGLKGNFIVMVNHSDEFLGAYYPDTQDPELAQGIQVDAGEEVGPIDFHLVPAPCTRNVRGQVADEGTGLPIPGIMVECIYSYTGGYASSESMETWEPPPPPLDYIYPVFTDEQGMFAFTILGPGDYQLYISDPRSIYLYTTYPKQGELVEYGGGVYQESYFEVSECQVIDDIRISLKRYARLEGQVLDGATPLGGVQVQAIGSAPKPSWGAYSYSYSYAYPYSQGLSDITDTAGRFTIGGLAENSFILMADDLHDRGYGIGFCEDPNVEGIPRVIPVNFGDTLAGLDIPMEAGFPVSGRVLDTEGNPLAHIRIKATITQFAFQDPNQADYWDDWSLYNIARYASTQEDGTYVLNGLCEGMYTITATDPNLIYISNSLSDLPLSASPDGGLPDLILSRGGVLSGRVTNASGEPLAGIMVQASQGSYYYGSGDSTSYDPNTGTYDGSSDPNTSTGTEYDPNDGTGEVDDPNSYGISSPDYTYTDPLYYPYEQFQATTKEDGTYRITGLPAGDYSLSADDPKEIYLAAQYSTGLLTVVEGEEISNLDFCLYRGGTIAGTIRDAATEDSLSGAIVRAYLDEEDDYYYSSPSDDQGRYTITKLPTGTYSLCISSFQNYQPQCYSNVTNPKDATLIEVVQEQSQEGIDFNLLQGYEISGRVLDAGTDQVISAACSVSLINEQYVFVIGVYTNNVGEYHFKGIPPGAYTIQVEYCYGYYPDCYRTGDDGCTTILISQGGTFDGFDIFLDPKASISGRVVDESDGTPLSNKYVFAIPFFGIVADPNVPYYGYGYGFYASGSSTATDPNGFYTIRNLEEGEYRILANDPWYVYASEYYDNVSPDQLDQAAVIHLDRSESLTGIDFGLQIGGTYSGSGSSSTTGVPYYYPYQTYGSYYGGMAGVGGTSSYFGMPGIATPSSYYGMAYGSSGASGVPQWQVSPAPETQPPQITSDPVQQVLAGRSYVYQVQAADSGTDTAFTYSLKLKPEGMIINAKSGVMQWKPTNEDEGESIVQAAAYNASGQMALQSFRVHVVADYTPPGEVRNLKSHNGDQKVTLSWTPPEDTDGDLSEQVLYIDKGTGYEDEIILPKTASTYTVKALENGKQYSFRIITRDELGNESEGTSATATPRKTQIFPVDMVQTQNPWFYPMDWLGVPKTGYEQMPQVFSGWNQQLFDWAGIMRNYKNSILSYPGGSYYMLPPWQHSLAEISSGNTGYTGIMGRMPDPSAGLPWTWWLGYDRSYLNRY